jgi:rhodanese-related sulfurtransferase/TusA-related sulfurtransferase
MEETLKLLHIPIYEIKTHKRATKMENEKEEKLKKSYESDITVMGYYFKHIFKYLIILIKKKIGRTKWSEISVDDLLNLLNAIRPPLIFDIRTPQEFADGHIANATSISLSEITSNLEDLQSFKDQSIVTICPGGGLSLVAVDVLSKAGFKDVKSLKGGMDLWYQKGYPITTAVYSHENIDLSSVKDRTRINEGNQPLDKKYDGEIHKTLDVRNINCPTPILKSKKALKALKTGQVLEILASHPSSIPSWALATGQELLISEERDPQDFRFLVKRKKEMK